MVGRLSLLEKLLYLLLLQQMVVLLTPLKLRQLMLINLLLEMLLLLQEHQLGSPTVLSASKPTVSGAPGPSPIKPVELPYRPINPLLHLVFILILGLLLMV